MDPLARLARLAWGLEGIVLALVLSGTACQPEERSGSPSAQPSPASPTLAPLAPAVLRIAPERLSRIVLSPKHGAAAAQPTVIEHRAHGWRIVSPIQYPADQTAVESLIAVLAEIEIVKSAAGDPQAIRQRGLADDTGIEVKAWAGDDLQSHFIVGWSAGEETYVRLAGDPRILTVRGRCRRIFDKKLDELRHPVITSFDMTEIEGVRYSGPFGVLELVADPAEPLMFVPKGTTIRSFDRRRASQQVSVLANLRAKGFVDPPVDRAATGLFADDTPRATLLLRRAEGTRAVDVWVGTRTRDGRLHLRTSEAEQIYLVSAHLESSLVVHKSQLERSDELMQKLQAQRERAEHAEKNGGAHTHGQPKPPPSRVPPELLSALRALAREQSADR